jgi:hypothetical protein
VEAEVVNGSAPIAPVEERALTAEPVRAAYKVPGIGEPAAVDHELVLDVAHGDGRDLAHPAVLGAVERVTRALPAGEAAGDVHRSVIEVGVEERGGAVFADVGIEQGSLLRRATRQE